eukprot:CCRYP_020238-RC/>CCRYP_020238-RC protein AED:0.13 eAED:0.13 QI:0/0.75/0.6/0.8/0.75/0.6/5/529/454
MSHRLESRRAVGFGGRMSRRPVSYHCYFTIMMKANLTPLFLFLFHVNSSTRGASALSASDGVRSLASTTANGVDCTSNFCENQIQPDFLLKYRINVPQGTDPTTCDGCTISMETIYDGDAWVSIAFSTTGQMTGSQAVIGIPGGNGNVPQKYNLFGRSASDVQPMSQSQQTLTDASIQVTNGQTIMKFTKIMSEPNEIPITTGDNEFLWAYGSSPPLGYHAARGSYVQNLSTGASAVTATPNKAAWLAHGIMAFLAWGVFSPFAVNFSLFRSLLPKGSVWFQLHRALNSCAYALTIAAFAVAAAYYSKEGSPHFDGEHQKMGLAMLIMASVQVLGGIFRPHVPEEGEKKPPVRSAWELGHRVLGTTVLACGFWEMREGIYLYSQKYSVDIDDQNKLAVAYWIWIGLMTASIGIGLGFFKTKKQEEPIGGETEEKVKADEDPEKAAENEDATLSA